ncbi:hypothetical protein B0H19DRAFT_1160914 [Mycena capillaripes]|nr:hypothetical protein B0H19DRAFT_1160914 [Mycena capillaripes]
MALPDPDNDGDDLEDSEGEVSTPPRKDKAAKVKKTTDSPVESDGNSKAPKRGKKKNLPPPPPPAPQTPANVAFTSQYDSLTAATSTLPSTLGTFQTTQVNTSPSTSQTASWLPSVIPPGQQRLSYENPMFADSQDGDGFHGGSGEDGWPWDLFDSVMGDDGTGLKLPGEDETALQQQHAGDGAETTWQQQHNALNFDAGHQHDAWQQQHNALNFDAGYQHDARPTGEQQHEHDGRAAGQLQNAAAPVVPRPCHANAAWRPNRAVGLQEWVHQLGEGGSSMTDKSTASAPASSTPTPLSFPPPKRPTPTPVPSPPTITPTPVPSFPAAPQTSQHATPPSPPRRSAAASAAGNLSSSRGNLSISPRFARMARVGESAKALSRAMGKRVQQQEDDDDDEEEDVPLAARKSGTSDGDVAIDGDDGLEESTTDDRPFSRPRGNGPKRVAVRGGARGGARGGSAAGGGRGGRGGRGGAARSRGAAGGAQGGRYAAATRNEGEAASAEGEGSGDEVQQQAEGSAGSGSTRRRAPLQFLQTYGPNNEVIPLPLDTVIPPPTNVSRLREQRAREKEEEIAKQRKKRAKRADPGVVVLPHIAGTPMPPVPELGRPGARARRPPKNANDDAELLAKLQAKAKEADLAKKRTLSAKKQGEAESSKKRKNDGMAGTAPSAKRQRQ